MVRALLVAVLISLPGFPADTGTISGKVVHAISGKPVPRVRISLRPTGSEQNPPVPIDSGPEGDFAFVGVPSGRWRLGAEKAGYVPQEYGPGLARTYGTTIDLETGAGVEGIEFKLMPAGSIAGNVVDDEGDPVPFRASIFRSSPYAGAPVGVAGVDEILGGDSGRFRFGALPPGSYMIWIEPTRPFIRPVGRTIGQTEHFWVSTWYPSSATAASARVIQVGPGEAIAGITVTLRKAVGYRVSGRLVGRPPGMVRVQAGLLRPVNSPADRPLGAYGPVGPDGEFDLGPVEPGDYVLVFSARTASMPASLGTHPLAVHGDIEGLVVTVPKPRTVTGRVLLENEDTPASVRHLWWIAQTGGSVGTTRIDADGRFTLDSLPPGRYSLRIALAGRPGTSRSVRVGGRIYPGHAVEIPTGDPGELEIRVSTEAGIVEGTVVDGGEPASAVVALIPEPFDLWRLDQMRQVTTDRAGRFSAEVTPGTYRVAAWFEVPPTSVLEPAGIKPYLSKTTVVEVKRNERRNVALDLLHPVAERQ